MRKVFTLVLFTVFLVAVAAKDNMAILPFSGGEGEEGETIAELFSFEPELTAVFNPVPRTSINRAIRNEQRFQLGSGMTDPDTAASLGKQVGAQYVVSGSITAVGKQKLLIIAILKLCAICPKIGRKIMLKNQLTKFSEYNNIKNEEVAEKALDKKGEI